MQECNENYASPEVDTDAFNLSLINGAAVGNNLRSWLSISLRVEDVDGPWEYDALSATWDVPVPVMFEIPVSKISKTSKAMMLRSQ